MAAVIIRKKDVERIGKEVLNEMFNFLHKEYILTEFKEMQDVQNEFLINLRIAFYNTLNRKHILTNEQKNDVFNFFFETVSEDGKRPKIREKIKQTDYFSTKGLDFFEICKPDILKKLCKRTTVNFAMEEVDTEGIYKTVYDLKLDMEINEDLYYKTKAFLDIFRVFDGGYIYLED